MKVLAIGDIHTKAEIVDKAIALIDSYDKIVFIGDYADDWGKEPIDTINIWDKMRALKEKYPKKVHTIVGNHDFAYLLTHEPYSGGFNPVTKMLLNIPENKPIKKWLGATQIKVKIDGITYSHAGYTDAWEEGDGLWDSFSPIWVRPTDGVVYKPKQVFGHTPCNTCYEVAPSVWCIDTFSTYRDGQPIGDGTVLEIINGKKFNKVKL